MPDPEALRSKVAQFRSGQKVTIGKWLGRPCIQTQNRVVAASRGRRVVHRPGEEARAQAQTIADAHVWDRNPARNPGREWIQIAADQSSEWDRRARPAYDYVRPLPKASG